MLPVKKGFVQNFIIFTIVLAITIPTIWYILNKGNLHPFNSFTPPSEFPASPSPQTQLVNPASVYCNEQGGTTRIVTNPDGSQGGMCDFSNGTTCDEWAYFRKECSPNKNRK